MAFAPKAWQNQPSTATKINASALIDLETRLAAIGFGGVVTLNNTYNGGSYNAVAGDVIVAAPTASGVTVNLPAPAQSTTVTIIVGPNISSTNTISVAPSSGLIYSSWGWGLSTIRLGHTGATLCLVSDGTNWYEVFDTMKTGMPITAVATSTTLVPGQILRITATGQTITLPSPANLPEGMQCGVITDRGSSGSVTIASGASDILLPGSSATVSSFTLFNPDAFVLFQRDNGAGRWRAINTAGWGVSYPNNITWGVDTINIPNASWGNYKAINHGLTDINGHAVVPKAVQVTVAENQAYPWSGATTPMTVSVDNYDFPPTTTHFTAWAKPGTETTSALTVQLFWTAFA